MSRVRIWHRQQNEPEHAYAIFRVYLRLPLRRTVVQAVKSFADQSPVPISRQEATLYCLRHDWKHRALAYDNWKTERDEEWIRKRVLRDQVVITKKQILGREIVVNEALRHLKEISSRSLAGVDAAELLRNIQTIRQSFDMLGLGKLDAEYQLRAISQGSGRTIRSVRSAEDPERLLGLPDESDAVQCGNPEEETVLEKADRDLPGGGRSDDPNDTGSSG